MNSLDVLFDVADANASETISLYEDKMFQLEQREKGWIVAMGSTDYSLEKKKRKTTYLEKNKRAAMATGSEINNRRFEFYLKCFHII